MKRFVFLLSIVAIMFCSCEEERSSDANLERLKVFVNDKLVDEILPSVNPTAIPGSTSLFNPDLGTVYVDTDNVFLEPVTSAKSVSSIKVVPRSSFAGDNEVAYNLKSLRMNDNKFFIIIESENLLSAKRYWINIIRRK